MGITLRAAIVTTLLLPIPAAAQPHSSAAAAGELGRKLEVAGLDAIAAVDPEQPDTFVAALYIPGGQLLVVSAHHPSADAIRYRIAAGQYRDVYVDVQGTPTPDGKFFVQDARADGILSARPGTGDVDVIYEDGVHRTMFNGDTKGQHLTDEQYDAKLAAADARYARMLALLTAVEPIRR
jgi:hypothetical protein